MNFTLEQIRAQRRLILASKQAIKDKIATKQRLFVYGGERKQYTWAKDKRTLVEIRDNARNSKLTKEDVYFIREQFGRITTKTMSKKFDVTPNTIRNIGKRETWMHT